MGMLRFTACHVSKASVVSFTRAAVQVKAVAPGYVETNTNGTVGVDEKPAVRIVGQIPVHRVGRAEKLGPPVMRGSSSTVVRSPDDASGIRRGDEGRRTLAERCRAAGVTPSYFTRNVANVSQGR
jgi:NAD(P)-dependent dehydrogenase (short-subunit alcohol dehydrogenase family)